ncbi:hypothetical protein HHK36_008506 [Tetracentron sinense]|uniref:ditrans,polycis-polyprenyl diphosphate synthase [(2E,6E)-farnesyldiphosphate specific] n=1 Tax=Tetracentron sinense TaxID=13715 RepID=A0A834ZFK8_TETSI|nr:hypothetical protein HHK36_008506 [Tetracentron sinense]
MISCTQKRKKKLQKSLIIIYTFAYDRLNNLAFPIIRDKLPLTNFRFYSHYSYALIVYCKTAPKNRKDSLQPRMGEREDCNLENGNSRCTVLGDDFQKMFSSIKHISPVRQIDNLVLQRLWHFLHPTLSIVYFFLSIAHVLIPSGLLAKYKSLNLSNLQGLAAAVNSEEVHNTSRVVELLRWLLAFGMKNVGLYNLDGVLKESKETVSAKLSYARLWEISPVRQIVNLVLQRLWHFLHRALSIVFFFLGMVNVLESCLITSGLLAKYKSLDLSNLHCLAIVVSNEEAHNTSRVVELVRWLSAIGVKHVCLYDMNGVLKESKKTILAKISNARLWEAADLNVRVLTQLGTYFTQETDEKDLSLDQKQMILEFVSFSDGKEGAAKAANFLCSEYLKPASLDGDQEDLVFTEPNMTKALRAVGCGGTEPNLLLVYGPARCHLGFPTWRMRYMEIVHMGPLKFMKYGSLVKAIHKFTMVHQNYG